MQMKKKGIADGIKQEERGPKETLQRMRHKMGRFENISRSTKEELKHNGENLRETGWKGKDLLEVKQP